MPAHIRRRERRHFAAAAAVLAVAVGACGSDESGAEITIVGGETVDDPTGEIGFALVGDDVTVRAPRLEVAAGEQVVVTLQNKHGQYSRTSGLHNFAVVPELDDLPTLIATGKIDEHIMWESATPDIPSGEEVQVTFVPETAGTYLYLCTIPGHSTAGMIGEFVVT